MPSTPHPVEDAPCPGFISALIQRCGQGDAAALGSLFDLLYGVVAATVRRREPGRSADDVIHDVFLEVWRLAPSYQPGGPGPVAWVLDLASATTMAETSSRGGHPGARMAG